MNNYTIDQLINIQQVEQLLETHVRISGIACGLMDNDLNIIIGAGLQQVCTQFLWEHPDSFARCWRNDPEIRQALDSFNGELYECRCKNGMINIAMPIVIEDRRLAILFSGQFFYDDQPPNLAWFQSQAAELGFDHETYLAAVGRAPVFSRGKVDTTMRFLHQLVQMLAETGYTNLMRQRELEERKRTEQQLELLNFAFDHVKEGAFLVKLTEGGFVYVNQEACRSLGYSKDELIGKSPLDINPDFYPEMLNQIIADLHEQGSITFESLHRTKSGQVFPVELTATLFEYDNTKFSLCLARNTTERKYMVQALRESEERFQLFAELSPDLIFIRHGKQIVYANQAAARMVGAQSSLDLIGKSILDFALPERREQLNSLITANDSKPVGTVMPPFEETLVRTDGSHITVELMAVRFQYRGMPCSQILMRNITDRKHTEQQIKLLSHAIEQAREGVFLIDSEGRFIYVNQEACRSLEYRMEELIGMTIPDIDPDFIPTRTAEHYLEILTCGTQTFETRHRTQAGRIFPVEITASTIEYNGTTYLLSMARDISERKQTEQRLYDKQQRLKELALELSLSDERERRHIATELHDTLGQDLTLARIKMGGLNKTELLPNQRALVSEMRALIESAINRVRSFTRQIYPPVLESAGLEAALKWLTRQLETDYALQITYNDDLSNKTVSREFQIELYNSVRELLINVAKHAGTTTACLSISREADLLAIRVEDDGIGFEPETALDNQPGDGFGLFTIRRRIMHMGGTLKINSLLGSGTEIIIRVPVRQQTASEPAGGEQQ